MIGGTIDGRYGVLRVIGEGGMGAVYEAQHLGTGRRVAIKVIRAQMAENAEAVQRFQREARAAGSIETPHIVQVLDTGRDPATGFSYMVMELLHGEDLQHLLKRCGRLAPELALRIVGQACLGLGKAHEAGVVHRDIKPANLFLSRLDSGQILVKVVDFGIAKTVDVVGAEDASLTRTGGMVGSPLYVSPEQAMGRKTIDQRTDVWSIGVVLYQALAGRLPRVRTDTVVALMMRICTEPAPPIQDLAPWVPPQVALLVHRMLAIDPAARFQSVAAVLETIGPWLPRGLSIQDHEIVPLPRALEAQVADRAVLESEVATVRVSFTMGDPQRVPQTPPAQTPPAQTPPAQTPPAQTPSAQTPSAKPPAIHVPSETATPSGESALSVSQGTSSVPAGLRSSRLRPLLALALVASAGGIVAYALGDHDPVLASTGASSAPATVESPAPSPPPPDERTARLAVDPPDAKVVVDGDETPIESGGVVLRGALGSVHHVRVARGTQSTDGDVAITSLGAVPSRLRLELAAPRSPRPTPLNDVSASRPKLRAPPDPSATPKAASKPRIPEPDRNFE